MTIRELIAEAFRAIAWHGLAWATHMASRVPGLRTVVAL